MWCCLYKKIIQSHLPPYIYLPHSLKILISRNYWHFKKNDQKKPKRVKTVVPLREVVLYNFHLSR